MAEAMLNVGSAEFSRGEIESAQRAFERALQIETAAFGPQHPKLARPLNNLAAVARARGDAAAAREALVRALAIRESAYGPTHSKVVSLVLNIAVLDAENGRLDEAMAGFQRARAASVEAFGEDSVHVARADASIGATAFNQKNMALARRTLQSAIAKFETHLGPDSEELAAPVFTLAHVHYLGGELDEAVAGYARSTKIREKVNGPDHPGAVDGRVHWAKALRARADARREAGDAEGAAADETTADALDPLPKQRPGQGPADGEDRHGDAGDDG